MESELTNKITQLRSEFTALKKLLEENCDEMKRILEYRYKLKTKYRSIKHELNKCISGNDNTVYVDLTNEEDSASELLIEKTNHDNCK